MFTFRFIILKIVNLIEDGRRNGGNGLLKDNVLHHKLLKKNNDCYSPQFGVSKRHKN